MNYFKLKTKLSKQVYSYEEILKIFPDEKVETLQTSLSRLVRSGSLKRIKRSYYLDWHADESNLRELAAVMYYPKSYIGDLTVLAELGIISNNLPHIQKDEIHHTSTKRQLSFAYKGNKYLFSEFIDELFFGFEEKFSEELQAPYLEVTTEKALLDYLYRYGFKVIEDLNVDLLPDSFSIELYRGYAKRFPKRVQEYVVF